MATTNYSFPTIDPAARFDGANDINKLADAIDTSMKQVELLGKDAQYELKPATATRLGGVRIGENVNVASDGTISVDTDPYTLPPASNTTLGGVIIPAGSGFNLQPDGTLSIDDASVQIPANSIGTEQIVDGAVTNQKLAADCVTYEKLGQALRDDFDKASAYVGGNPSPVELSYTRGDSSTLTASAWGNIIFLSFVNFPLVVSTPSDTFDIATFKNISDKPNGSVYENAAMVEYDSAGSPVGLCNVDYPNRFRLQFNGNLAAGTYEVNGTAAVVFI